MKEFKTKKANLLFVVLPKDAMNVCIDDNDICFIQKCITKYIGINKGYTLLGKLSTITEEVAKGLVDEFKEPEFYTNYVDYVNGGKETKGDGIRSIVVGFSEAIPSLTSIAHHLGMELTDNIYILKRI